jgi:hypothetical protein
MSDFLKRLQLIDWVLALCLALTACSEPLPQDTLTRFAHTLAALKSGYRALCTDREDAAECVHISETVNGAIDKYSALNDSLKEKP